MRFWIFTLLLALSFPAFPETRQDGVDVKRSRLLLLPASAVERSAAQQYSRLMRAAAQKGVLNIRDINAAMPKVLPLYEVARREPPPK